MAKQANSLPTADDAARAASEVLSCRGNRLRLVEALLLTILMCSSYAVIDGTAFVAAQMLPKTPLFSVLIPVAQYAAWLLLSLFVILPLVIGLFRMAYRMEQNRETVLAELFHSFGTSRDYGRALGLSFGFTWRAVLLAIVIGGTYWLAERLHLPLPAIVGVAVLLVAEFAVGVFLMSRSFYTLAFSLREPNASLSQCRRGSARVARAFRLRGVGFLLHFLPQLLLGLLTFGILLLMHTLPSLLLAYFRFCQSDSLSDFIERENIT